MRRTAVVLAVGLSMGTGVAFVLDGALRLHVDAPAAEGAVAPPEPRALPLRLVDMGGVGIAPDASRWGRDYLHDALVFHDLILADPPYVDDAAFRRVAADWERYLDRMAAYGANGVVVPIFLELVTFDGLDGGAVYGASSAYRARHLALRARFAELFRSARARGFTVLLKTDMVALTEPLERYLRGTPAGLDPHAPAFWRAYRAACEELFGALPEVDGVVVRVGEAGRLFSRPGWPYWSRFAVRDAPALRTMLTELLPAFEARGRRLVLRTWSVGPGPLGSLHTNPATYEAALGGIDSESLLVSTKYLQGDFFSFLPTNPTLFQGAHRRLVEFQARREFEGFGAFPDYMAVPHQRALRQILARNPRVVGSWLWTQDGGPVRAGPLSLYPLHGAWAWIDANVDATARLAQDPGADVGTVAREWVARTLSSDPEVVAAVSNILLRSRDAVERGFYVRPFAEKRVRLGAVDVPPLLWVMEWDQVGGWSAALGTIYRVLGTEAERAVAEGFEAVGVVADARRALEGVEGRLVDRADAYRALHASLAYEESLLEALAHHRRAFLALYRWLDTGERDAHDAWRRAVPEYLESRRRHQAVYAGNLDQPAFDFRPADAALAIAERTVSLAWLARALVAAVAACAVLGVGRRARWFPPTALAATCALTAALLSSFVSWRLAAFAVLVPAAMAAGSWLAWVRPSPVRLADAAAALAPLAAPCALLAAGASLRGPLHFWFLFWTAPSFRAVFSALFVAAAVWAAAEAWTHGRALTGSAGAAWGGALAALGVALVATAAVLPRTEQLLSSLHDPLAMLPLTFAVVLGIVTYLGVPLHLGPALAAAGIGLAACGVGLATWTRTTVRRRSLTDR